MEFISQPWPWYVGGPLVAIIMLLLIYLGKSFGFSSNFRTICSAMGAGKSCDFFAFDWKSQKWNLLFLVGAVLGGIVSVTFLGGEQIPEISAATTQSLHEIGMHSVGETYSPTEIFKTYSWGSIFLLLIGGLFVGFGTRYAGGCTSGHAISGLSNLQLPSLIAVIGFFIGGLLMVHLIFPFIF